MQRKLIIFTMLLALFALSSCAQQIQNTAIVDVSAAQVKEKLSAGENIVVLDVRTEGEFNGPLGHIDGAVLIPVDQLAGRIAELEVAKDKDIIVVCRSGNRSQSGTKILLQNNYKAFNMAGGMIAWNELEK